MAVTLIQHGGTGENNQGAAIGDLLQFNGTGFSATKQFSGALIFNGVVRFVDMRFWTGSIDKGAWDANGIQLQSPNVTNDVLRLQSAVAHIVNGNVIGGIVFESQDPDIGLRSVAHVRAVATGTHTASSLPTSIIVGACAAGSINAIDVVEVSAVGINLTQRIRHLFSAALPVYDMKDVTAFSSNSALTGSIKITLPIGMVTSNVRLTIQGYDQTNDLDAAPLTSSRPWTLEISCSPNAQPQFFFYSARSNGRCPFSSVRFCTDGTNACILLGTLTTTWASPRIVLRNASSTTSTYDGTYTIEHLTSEAGITVYRTAPVNGPQTALQVKRVLPQTVGDFVECADIGFANGQAFRVSTVMSTSATANAAKEYLFAVAWPQADNTWRRVHPLVDSGPGIVSGSGIDWALEVRCATNAQTLNVRLVCTTKFGTPTAGAQVLVNIEPLGGELMGFTETSATGTGAATVWWVNALVGQNANVVSLIDGANVSVGATTGTKIGNAVTEKLGFWGKAPVVQPASANQAALTNSSGGTADGIIEAVLNTTTGDRSGQINNNFTEVHRLLNEIRTALVNAGLIKGAA